VVGHGEKGKLANPCRFQRIKVVDKYIVDGGIVIGVARQCPLAGRFEALWRIGECEAHDAQAGVVGLLGEAAGIQHFLYVLYGGWACLGGLAQKIIRCPSLLFRIAFMALGHVFFYGAEAMALEAPCMQCYALVFKVDLYRIGIVNGTGCFAYETKGDAVVVPVLAQCDVVVALHFCLHGMPDTKGLGGQGLQQWPFEF